MLVNKNFLTWLLTGWWLFLIIQGLFTEVSGPNRNLVMLCFVMVIYTVLLDLCDPNIVNKYHPSGINTGPPSRTTGSPTNIFVDRLRQWMLFDVKTQPFTKTCTTAYFLKWQRCDSIKIDHES